MVDKEKDIPENREVSTSPIDNENILQNEGVSLSTANTQSELATMEVHKHPHDVTHKKNWKEYLLEFFMIFFAVFLGFVAENIREHVAEKERAKEYAISLISDLKSDTAMISEHIQQVTSTISRIDSLSIYISRKNLDEISSFELLHKSALRAYNPYTWNRATLEQIKGSGSLRYFRDSIVKKISAYDAFTRHMEYDYQIDQDQNDKVQSARIRVLDMDYPSGFLWHLYRHYDSLKTTSYYAKMKRLNKPLLTKDIHDVKTLVNEAVELGILIRVRRDFELPRLIKSATELIKLLKEEYYLN